ncbi:MAG: T9SS type A sorting domain-containing protein [Burkholderiales bacterium]|nr:T9SS type A sorting domain-containing protein [Bacteroidia bacterium]
MKKLITLFALLLCLTNSKAQNYVSIADTSFASWLQTNIPSAMLGNQMDTTSIDVTSRKSIVIQNRHIVTLDGIQYFDSLKTLDCTINVYDTINIRLSSIPALPQMLDTLICTGNALNSLPPLPSGLLVLLCGQNSLDSLPALPNTIKLLECWSNQLASLPVLSDSLIEFNCCNNFIQMMPALPGGLITFTCSNNQLQGLPALPGSLISLNCSTNPIQTIPALPNALLYLDCSGNQLSTLPVLPNTLENLICNNSQLSSLPALSNALLFLNCSQNQLSNLPALTASLNTINCSNNQLGSIPVLPSSLYKLNCNSNPLGMLPALPNTLALLYCNNDQLQSLPAQPNSLIDVDCSSNVLTALPALSTSLNILNCSNNQLTVLPSLPLSLNTLDCQTNQLTVLPSLPNALGTLNCSTNQLTGLPTFPSSFGYLNCNNNLIVSLPAMPGSLNYLTCSNNQLTNLPLLPTGLSVLDCSYNLIHCFDPFIVSSSLNISNNPFTCLPNYIPIMDLGTLNLPLCTAGNPFGCPSSFGIVGFTYQDNNNTCLKDSADKPLINIPLKIYDNSSNLLGSTYTAINGVYQFLDSANTYNVVVDTIGKPFQASCIYPGLDSTVTVAVLDTNVNFALKCKPGFDVGVQSIYTGGIIFPGQTHVLTVNAGDISRWYNLNCSSGRSGILSFIVAGPVAYMGPHPGSLVPSVSGNVFTYSIPDFGTINNGSDFRILLQTFPTAQAGDIICVTAKVNPITGDNYQSNNSYKACYNVVNSYDPNIKEVYPVDVAPSFNDWLTYTIHFQNTGNAPAFNIKLADTLDTELDLTTFQVTDYSHANTTTLNGRVLTVNFSNIQLPDSSSNPEGSIGFIQYRLKPKATWTRPYKIKNTAYIYFDFNAPIVTNTTYNSILDISTGINEQTENMITLYPNPTNGTFTIETNTNEKQTIRVFDMTGNSVISQTMENGKTTVNAGHLAAGIYSINIIISGAVINKKLVIVK